MDKSTILEFKPMIEVWGGFFSDESFESFGTDHFLLEYLIPELKKVVRTVFDKVIDKIGYTDHIVPRFLQYQYDTMKIYIDEYGSIEYNNILDDVYIMQPYMYLKIEENDIVKEELLNELVTVVKRYPYKIKIEDFFFATKDDAIKRLKYNPSTDIIYRWCYAQWDDELSGKVAIRKENKMYLYSYDKINIQDLSNLCCIDEVINRIQENGNGTLICICDL